jgi:hypothetical protein
MNAGQTVLGAEDRVCEKVCERVRHLLSPLRGWSFKCSGTHGLRRGLASAAHPGLIRGSDLLVTCHLSLVTASRGRGASVPQISSARREPRAIRVALWHSRQREANGT